MAKLLQNKIAESGLTLPAIALFALATWLMAGLTEGAWWPQLVCFVMTAAIIAELNNSNALIRVRSRMVSCTFLALSSAACILFYSQQGAIVQVCFAASYLILFHSYQDKQAVGWTFYAFFCIGLASLAFVQSFYFLPLLWLLMATNLLSLSWRTWLSSLLGLLAPYWFLLLYFIYLQDFTPLAEHFTGLAAVTAPSGYASLTIGRVLLYAMVVVLSIMGMAHLWRYGYEDKIRIRQLYGCFTATSTVTLFFIALQPQHYDVLMPVAILNASPLIAHFLTLTHTRLTNIAFFVIAALVALLTIFNLWMPSLTF